MAPPDEDAKKEAVLKAAGAAVTAGVLWSIFSSFKGKRKAAEGGVSVITTSTTNEDGTAAEEVFDIFPASPRAGGQDYYNDQIVKERIEKIIKTQGSEADVNVVYVEQEVVTYAKPEDAGKAAEEKKKPWFLSLFDGLGDGKNKFFDAFKPKEGLNPGPKVKGTSDRTIHNYEIKNGDTLWAISGKYGISLETLKAANGLSGDKIYAGEKLVIPPPE